MKFPPLKQNPVGSKTFLKLGPNVSITGVFRGDVETFHQIYQDGKYHPAKEGDPGAVFRFNVNFIVSENGQMVAKIFQGNYHDYVSLQEMDQQFDIDTIYVKITQTGERQTKRMSFSPIVKQKPDPYKLSQVELQVLKPKNEQNAYDEMSKMDDGFETLDDIPF